MGTAQITRHSKTCMLPPPLADLSRALSQTAESVVRTPQRGRQFLPNIVSKVICRNLHVTFWRTEKQRAEMWGSAHNNYAGLATVIEGAPGTKTTTFRKYIAPQDCAMHVIRPTAVLLRIPQFTHHDQLSESKS